MGNYGSTFCAIFSTIKGMDFPLMMQFWLVAVLMAMTPGADWAYAITAGLRARTVGPSITGMLAGYAVVILIVAVGVGALVAQYPAVLHGLTVLGAGYLLYLGWHTLRSQISEVSAAEGPVRQGAAGQFFRGAGISGINPKGMLLLLALLPQFTSLTAPWSSTAQMLVLGSLHILNCAVVYTIVAVGARKLLGTKPKLSVLVSKFSGVVMIVFGLVFLGETAITLLDSPNVMTSAF